MSHISYQASLARRDDLLRAGAERRRAAEVGAHWRTGRSVAGSTGAIVRRVRSALSTAGLRPAMS